MANKKPLYIENGRIQEYGPGDTISATIAPGAGGGGGGGMSPFWVTEPTPPSASDFTLLGSTGADPQADDTSRGVHLSVQGGGWGVDRKSLMEVSMPSGDWQITTCVVAGIMASDYRSWGIFIKDSSSGRIEQYGPSAEGPSYRRIMWTNINSYNSAASVTARYHPQVHWLRLVKDGSDLRLYSSSDGEHWNMCLASTVTGWTLAPDKVGIMVVCNAASQPENQREGIHVMSWEIT